jgi:4-nitrophenyl phosphatase
MLDAVLFDLDGTVYRGSEEVPGAANAIAKLADRGVPYRFVTNRSSRPPKVIFEHLRELSVPCTIEDVMTTAQATAEYLRSQAERLSRSIESMRAYVIGEEGLIQSLAKSGIQLVDDKVDWVVVGFDAQFTYEKLERACLLIREGAKLIASNPDPFFHTDKGLSPEAGALVSAIEVGAECKAVYVGKPQALMLEVCLKQVGARAEHSLMIGDNLHTDIPAGNSAGTKTALILTGVCTEEEARSAPTPPDYIIPDYNAFNILVEKLCSTDKS